MAWRANHVVRPVALTPAKARHRRAIGGHGALRRNLRISPDERSAGMSMDEGRRVEPACSDLRPALPARRRQDRHRDETARALQTGPSGAALLSGARGRATVLQRSVRGSRESDMRPVQPPRRARRTPARLVRCPRCRRLCDAYWLLPQPCTRWPALAQLWPLPIRLKTSRSRIPRAAKPRPRRARARTRS